MTMLSMACQNPEDRRARITESFRGRYHTEPRWAARAPGRVDLMGSHTDYNQGHVLTLSIDRETWIFVSPRNDGQVRLASLNRDIDQSFSVSNPAAEPLDDWGRYVQGVAVMLQRSGRPIMGFDGLVHGTVPLDSGLSSSASLESAAATVFERLGGFTLDPVEKARLCQRAENEWVGVNCGILDQYSSILGKEGSALLLDCRNLTHRHVDFSPDLSTVICNTCAPRSLDGSEYGIRRAQCESGAAFFSSLDKNVRGLRDVSLDVFARHESALPEQVARRCRFIIEEDARVCALFQALQTGDRPAIERITAASFAGARDLFEISVPAMEAMYDAMRAAPGCVGCRQAGAGFGGCMVAIVENGCVQAFRETTERLYRHATGIGPAIYPVRAAAGAGELLLG